MSSKPQKYPGLKKGLASSKRKGVASRLLSRDMKRRGRKRVQSQAFSAEHLARARAFLEAAQSAGFLGGEKSERVSGRVSPNLMSAAKARSGIDSLTMLLEYALSKVALEDDFGLRLLARKGSVPTGVEL